MGIVFAWTWMDVVPPCRNTIGRPSDSFIPLLRTKLTRHLVSHHTKTPVYCFLPSQPQIPTSPFCKFVAKLKAIVCRSHNVHVQGQ
jgi:hypothetical protein